MLRALLQSVWNIVGSLRYGQRWLAKRVAKDCKLVLDELSRPENVPGRVREHLAVAQSFNEVRAVRDKGKPVVLYMDNGFFVCLVPTGGQKAILKDVLGDIAYNAVEFYIDDRIRIVGDLTTKIQVSNPDGDIMADGKPVHYYLVSDYFCHKVEEFHAGDWVNYLWNVLVPKAKKAKQVRLEAKKERHRVSFADEDNFGLK